MQDLIRSYTIKNSWSASYQILHDKNSTITGGHPDQNFAPPIALFRLRDEVRNNFPPLQVGDKRGREDTAMFHYMIPISILVRLGVSKSALGQLNSNLNFSTNFFSFNHLNSNKVLGNVTAIFPLFPFHPQLSVHKIVSLNIHPRFKS